MQLARPVFAAHPKSFGRGPIRVHAPAALAAHPLSTDLKLFASTFAVGFLFVSVLLA